jgi:hypothetical protein
VYSASALEALDSDEDAALESYQSLYKLLVKARTLAAASDGAASHLLGHVRSKTHAVEHKLEKKLSDQLSDALKKISWPKPDIAMPADVQAEFMSASRKLLKLQLPDLEHQESEIDSSSHARPAQILLPFKVLVHQLELGFRYHFEDGRERGRVESPDRLFSYVMDKIMDRYIGFVQDYMQPILREEFHGTSLTLNSAYFEADSAFITALLPMLRHRLEAILPRVMEQGALLSRFMHQVQAFDTRLRDEWEYNGGSRTDAWPGLAGEILATDSVFSHWLKVEKKCMRRPMLFWTFG